ARLPDADDDGIENALDPCPFDADPSTGEFRWDPRVPEDLYFAAPGIPDDVDGLPYSCDPDPFERVVIGTCCHGDGDSWRNRADNCPLVKNPDNNDEDSDGIGDACDVLGAEITFPDGSKGSGLGPDDMDGRAEGIGNDAFDTCKVTIIEIGSGGTPPIAAGVYKPCNPNALLPAGGDGTTSEEEQTEETRQELLASLAVGMNITAGLESVPVGGSTQVVAACAEMENSLQPVAGVDITFEIDSQPGSDADLDGQAEVTS
ncbi:unnamed protein product, partial [marine sediment metagenome]